jgi:cytochrome b subunit of formate dehydrogenase
MFGFFIFINVVVFVLPRMALKFATIVLMVAIVLFYFLPENPVRAMAYSMLTGGMSVIALFTRSLVHRLIVRRWLRASAVTSLNS